MAALALNGGDQVVASDDGLTSYAQYVIYQNGKPYKILLINTDYYSGHGQRTNMTFTLTGLGSRQIRGLRFTAPSSEVKATSGRGDEMNAVTIGGKTLHQRNETQ